MFYPKLVFPTEKGRPFFYTNFVSTLDGKTAVKKAGYWPIGSEVDHKVLEELRSHADVLIHGSNLAKQFGEQTLKSLKKIHPDLAYYIVTYNPKQFSHLKGANITSSDPKTLSKELFKKGYKNILVEGGPTLLGSFLKEGLIDEVFLTIAPKLYGTDKNSALTLVEGVLFPPKNIKKLRLLSVKQRGDELFLRYRVE